MNDIRLEGGLGLGGDTEHIATVVVALGIDIISIVSIVQHKPLTHLDGQVIHRAEVSIIVHLKDGQASEQDALRLLVESLRANISEFAGLSGSDGVNDLVDFAVVIHMCVLVWVIERQYGRKMVDSQAFIYGS